MFSIIMPAFNSEDFILDAVNSVVNQSYKGWELLIVDDASSDATVSIIKDKFKNEPRIKLLSNKFPKGAAGARNTGIDESKNRYICFLDSDDIWGEHKLKNQLAKFAENEARLIYSDYFVISEGTRTGNLDILSTYKAPPYVDFPSMLKTCSIGCLTAAYDSYFFGKVFFPDSPKEDYALWLLLLKRCGKAYNTGNTEAYYRITSGSLSSNKFSEIKKQAYVLKNYGGIKGISLIFHMLSYAYWGVRKYRA